MPRIQNERGLGLVEVLIFVAVLAIVTLGVTSFLISSGERTKTLDVADTMSTLSNFATREIFNSRTLYWSVNPSSAVPSTLNRELYRCITKDGIACGSSTFYAMLVPGIPTAGMTYPTQRFAGLGSTGAAGDWNKRVLYGKDGTLCPVGSTASEFCPIEASVSMVCADEGCASMDRVGYLRVTLRIETVWSGTGIPESVKPIVRTELVKIAPPKGTLVAWGQNVSGEVGDGSSTQRNAPVWISTVDNLIEVSSTGARTSCAITDTNGLLCWGEGFTETPTTAFNLVNGVREVAPYVDYGCYLSTMGAVKCWGTNSYGELGDGTTNDSSTPVSVSGLTRGVVGIAVGTNYACALTTSGGVKCWGSNFKGQLGDGSTTDRSTPVDVSGLASGVAQISASNHTTCAVTTAGGAKCWGENSDAQVGDGTSTDRSTPVDVSGLTTNVAAISAGGLFTCALTTSGGAKCWGNNTAGQIGTGATSTAVTSPTDVTGLTTDVQMISAHSKHACVVKTDGSVKCWGANAEGEIGDGTTTDRYTPTLATGLSSNVIQVGAGEKHNLAITATSDTSTGTGTGTGSGTGSGTGVGVSGAALGWGQGQLNANGDPGAANRTVPDNIPTLSSNIVQLGGGINHSCALTTGGGVKCWGGNVEGEVGDGTCTNRTGPVDVSGLTNGVAAIAVGGDHACALTTGGAVKCWGRNEFGELGDGTTNPSNTPLTPTGMGSGIAKVGIGEDMSCAVTTGGGAKCWGAGANGRLGNGATTDQYAPVDVTGLTSGVADIVASGAHACALTTGGGVKCWGYNAHGELGDGSSTDRTTPVDVTGLTSGVAAIGVREFLSCALTTGGGVKCWGYNANGQVGNGASGADVATATDVSGLTNGVSEITVGGYHACALTTGGAMKCWGLNNSGQLGDGSTTDRNTPVDVSFLSSNIQKIGSGNATTFAIRTTALTGTGSGTGTGTGVSSGYAYCWGINNKNQTGIGNIFEPVKRPMPVDGLDANGSDPHVSDVIANATVGCSLMSNGSVQCWGNDYLGDGSVHTNYNYPREATGLGSGVTRIASGLVSGMCAIHSNTMKCWGRDLYLDGATKANYTTPTAVTGLGNVSAIGLSGHDSAGLNTMCAILSATGGLKCWGYNVYGEVGDGTSTEQFAPVDVTGLTSNVSAVSLGREHTCALTTGGAAKCWGRNQYSQLGDGTTNTTATPITVTGLGSGVSQIAVGFDHSCALTTGGGVKCWGRNHNGQLGDGSSTDRSTPVDVSGLTSGVSQISAGNHQTCARKNDGTSYCWGNYHLGNDSTAQSSTPVAVSGAGAATLKVNATRGDGTDQNGTACLVSSTTPPVTYWRAWGENTNSELMDGGSLQDQTSPIRPFFDPQLYPTPPALVSVGNSSSCFEQEPAGTTWCWGTNTYGQLGNGNSAPSTVPMMTLGGPVTGDPPSFDIFDTSCALDTALAQISCWGRNTYGELGDNSVGDRSSASFTFDYSLAKYVEVDVGQSHACGITKNHYLRCWGRNNHGQLGTGDSTDTTAPFKSAGAMGFYGLSAGKDSTCMIGLNDGMGFCTGSQHVIGCGVGTDVSVPCPVQAIIPPPLSSISVGEAHACATSMTSGQVMCWGSNAYGQLGDGSTTDSDPPVTVSGINTALEVVAGVDATCARLTDGTVKCWGRNNSGQLGNGSTTDSSTPVTVSNLSNVIKLGKSNGRSFFAEVGSLCNTAGSPFGGGAGTSSDPYLICSAAQFGNIGTASSSHFKLTRDLNLSSINGTWTPIASFSGTLDGDNHRVGSMSITENGTTGGGLFARVLATGGTIKNISFWNVAYTLGADQGANTVGGLIGTMNSGSFLTDVSVSPLIVTMNGKTTGIYGGLVGSCAGTISGGWHIVLTNGTTELQAGPFGGFVGELTGTLSQLHVQTSATIAFASAPTTPVYGVVVGRSTGGSITEIVSSGGTWSLAATGATTLSTIGGVVGQSDATTSLTRIKRSGPISIGANLTVTNVGGIAGVATGTMSDIEMSGAIGFDATTVITNFGAIAGSYTTATAAMSQVLAIGTIDNVNGTLSNYKGHVGVCDGFATYAEVLRSPGLMVRGWAAGCSTGVTDSYECADCSGTVKDGSCAGAAHDFTSWTATHWTTLKANSACAAYPAFNLDR